MKITIERYIYSNYSVVGKLYIDGEFECYTLENPELNNIKNESCVVEGKYLLKPWDSPKFGECFKIFDPPNRTDILIHVGNTSIDTQGCILVGKNLGALREEFAVLNSRAAMIDLKVKVKKPCDIEIKRKPIV